MLFQLISVPGLLVWTTQSFLLAPTPMADLYVLQREAQFTVGCFLPLCANEAWSCEVGLVVVWCLQETLNKATDSLRNSGAVTGPCPCVAWAWLLNRCVVRCGADVAYMLQWLKLAEDTGLPVSPSIGAVC